MPVRPYPTLSAYLEANRRTTPEYDDVALALVQGSLPPDLLGTLLRNGNGHFEQHGVPYDHLFDGDGMVARFTFDGQQVSYRNRYVRTQEFVAEEAAGRMLYRSFGTNLPGGLRWSAPPIAAGTGRGCAARIQTPAPGPWRRLRPTRASAASFCGARTTTSRPRTAVTAAWGQARSQKVAADADSRLPFFQFSHHRLRANAYITRINSARLVLVSSCIFLRTR